MYMTLYGVYYNVMYVHTVYIVQCIFSLHCIQCSASSIILFQPIPFSEEHDFVLECVLGMGPDLLVLMDSETRVSTC